MRSSAAAEAAPALDRASAGACHACKWAPCRTGAASTLQLLLTGGCRCAPQARHDPRRPVQHQRRSVVAGYPLTRALASLPCRAVACQLWPHPCRAPRIFSCRRTVELMTVHGFLTVHSCCLTCMHCRHREDSGGGLRAALPRRHPQHHQVRVGRSGCWGQGGQQGGVLLELLHVHCTGPARGLAQLGSNTGRPTCCSLTCLCSPPVLVPPSCLLQQPRQLHRAHRRRGAEEGRCVRQAEGGWPGGRGAVSVKEPCCS